MGYSCIFLIWEYSSTLLQVKGLNQRQVDRLAYPDVLCSVRKSSMKHSHRSSVIDAVMHHGIRQEWCARGPFLGTPESVCVSYRRVHLAGV